MIVPKKSLGQNFLLDHNIIKKIINQTNIQKENIVEIGPGYGGLTDQIISQNPKSLTLIEKDNNIFKYLIKKYHNQNNINVIHSDILKYDFSKFKKIKIISNLPYNVSTKIIMRLIFYNKNIESLIFMIQKELATKFDYKKNKMNKYKFIIKLCSDYKILFNVSNKVFYPKPKVISTVVEFKLNNIKINKEKLYDFTDIIFKNKRKKIKNKIINTSFIDEKILNKRVEELNFSELLKIYKSF